MAEKARRIYFVAGEASGDAHGARLIRAMKSLDPQVFCEGLGGVTMQQAGMQLDYDLAAEGIMGFVEVLKHAPRMRRMLLDTAGKLRADPPDAVVLIDYPGFNIRLAKLLHGSGIPVIYYISPQVWAWKKGRIHTLAKVCHKMLVIFPFEEKLYLDIGMDCVYVGHPLVEELGEGAKYETDLSAVDEWWNALPRQVGDRSLSKNLRIVSDPETTAIAIEFIVDARSVAQPNQGIAYRQVSELEADQIHDKTGFFVDTSYVHTIQRQAVLHTLNRHGDPAKEDALHQLAVTESDVKRIADLTKPEFIVAGSKNRRGQSSIIYEIPAQAITIVIQEIRVGRGELAFVTMYKKQREKKLGEFSTTREQMSETPALYAQDGWLRRFSPKNIVSLIANEKRGIASSKSDESQFIREPILPKPPGSHVRNTRTLLTSSIARIPHSAPTRQPSTVIGLLPGSRAQEIARLYPDMLKIARGLKQAHPELEFATPCTNETRAKQLRELAGDFPVEILPGAMHDVLRRARFCLVASGTATLETALFGVPMIILYRVSPLTYRLAKMLVDIAHIGIVNVLAGRGIVPEYIQGDIRTERILPQALTLIEDTPARETMLQDLQGVRDLLGGGGASLRAAQEILSVIPNSETS